MKNIFLAVISLCLLAGCATTDSLRQGGTMNALMGGLYDGAFSSCQIRPWGDFGIGTFDKLDGEMIVLGGSVYQAKADGTVVLKKKFTSPFALLKTFSADETFEIPTSLNFTELKGWLDIKLPGTQLPYAIRIDGEFETVTVRSVPAQEKPYRKLTDVVKDQPVFEKKNIRGTLVGFRLPENFQGMNVPGYHFHFLSQDRTFGGHVLDVKVTEGTALVDRAGEWSIVFPQGQDFAMGLFAASSPESVTAAEAMPAR